MGDGRRIAALKDICRGKTVQEVNSRVLTNSHEQQREVVMMYAITKRVQSVKPTDVNVMDVRELAEKITDE